MDVGIKIDVSGLLNKIKRSQQVLESASLLKAIGLRQLKWVNDNFASSGKLVGGWKPLSAFTLAHRKHGGSKPLQDTGVLRTSFTPGDGKNNFRVSQESVTIGSAVPYASYQNDGTGPIYPVNGKVLAIPGPGGRVSFLRHTKGIPARRMLPTVTIGRELAISLVKAQIRSIENGAV